MRFVKGFDAKKKVFIPSCDSLIHLVKSDMSILLV